MGWRDLEYRERWSLIVSTIQALATLGAFLVAIVGIWRVAPIITYQVEKQRAEPIPLAVGGGTGSALAGRFVNDALEWWSPRVVAYGRIVELVKTRTGRGWELSFELQKGVGVGDDALTSDVLVVHARHAKHEDETLRVEVNESAIQPGHFIQRQINGGFFERLEPDLRRQVEVAVEHYARNHMLPRIPPPHIRADMSIEEVADEIALHQDDRETAARQIPGLAEVIEEVTRG